MTYKYEWKKGDKLVVVDIDNLTDDELRLGEIVISTQDISSNYENGEYGVGCKINSLRKGPMNNNFKLKRFALLGGSDDKPMVEVKTIEKHIVLKDSCSNVIDCVKHSYEDAVAVAHPSINDGSYTIYKLVAVARVESTYKVTPVKVLASLPADVKVKKHRARRHRMSDEAKALIESSTGTPIEISKLIYSSLNEIATPKQITSYKYNNKIK